LTLFWLFFYDGFKSSSPPLKAAIKVSDKKRGRLASYLYSDAN